MGGTGLLWVWRFVVLLQLISGVLGWGKEGHYATCKIAEEYLTEDAKVAVKRLLPDYAGGDLASLCSWPDEIRFHYHWSGALHYVDTPDFKCNYEYCMSSILMLSHHLSYAGYRKQVIAFSDLPNYVKRIHEAEETELIPNLGDCHDSSGHKDMCVTGAIYNYTRQLEAASNSYAITNYNLTEALLFLSHFVGDVHQPLHVGFTGDLGGNTIIVRWYRRKTNLHHVWDTMIIDSALKTFYESDLSQMIQAIQRNITDGWSNDVPSWGDCASNKTVCPDPYASESIKLACKYAYRNATPGSTLTDDYFLSRLPIVEKRIAQAGVRLASILNRVFASPKQAAHK